MEAPYSSFFTSVVRLDKDQRTKLFFLVCIPIRFIVGLLFYMFHDNVAMSYISAIWGVLWLWFMIKHRRWEEHDITPWWWNGVWRIFFRAAVSSVLLSFGFVGIVSDKDREFTNDIIAFTIWVDVLIGVIDKGLSMIR